MYKVSYHPKAFKQLKKLPRQDQIKLTQVIYKLRQDPFSKKLNIRRFYRTLKSYRIRIGDLRAIYELDNKKKEIYIRHLGYRGQIY